MLFQIAILKLIQQRVIAKPQIKNWLKTSMLKQRSRDLLYTLNSKYRKIYNK